MKALMKKALRRFSRILLKALNNDYVLIGLFLLLWATTVALLWLPFARALILVFR